KQLSFALHGMVRRLCDRQEVPLAASEPFVLNTIDGTERTEDLHLSKVSEGYVLMVLGKNGEARADRAVRLSLHPRDFTDPVHVSLKTDDKGRVALGALHEIARVEAAGPDQF